MINTGTATPRLDLLGPILNEAFDIDGYLAHRMFKPLTVQKRVGAIPSLLVTNDQVLNVLHSPKMPFARIVSSLGEKTYACQEDGLEEQISKEDYDILGEDGAEAAVTRNLIHAILRARDNTIASSIFSATGESTFAGQVTTASATWDNASGDPYKDIADATEKIVRRVGSDRLTLAIGYGAYIKLCKNAKVQSAFRAIAGYTDKKAGTSFFIPPEQLAAIFNLQEVIVGKGVANTAIEGQAASRSFIIPSTYAALYVGSSGQQDANELCAGRMFVWEKAAIQNDLCTGTADAVRSLFMEMYAEPQTDSWVYRVRDYVDMKFTQPEGLELIKSI